MQYLKQMPDSTRVPVSEDTYKMDNFMEPVQHIIRTNTIVVYRALPAGQTPANMPPPERSYRYARIGQR